MTGKIRPASSLLRGPRPRAVQMRGHLDPEGEHASRWATVSSIAAKIGCTAQTLHEWVKNDERDKVVCAPVFPRMWRQS